MCWLGLARRTARSPSATNTLPLTCCCFFRLLVVSVWLSFLRCPLSSLFFFGGGGFACNDDPRLCSLSVSSVCSCVLSLAGSLVRPFFCLRVFRCDAGVVLRGHGGEKIPRPYGESLLPDLRRRSVSAVKQFGPANKKRLLWAMLKPLCNAILDLSIERRLLFKTDRRLGDREFRRD